MLSKSRSAARPTHPMALRKASPAQRMPVSFFLLPVGPLQCSVLQPCLQHPLVAKTAGLQGPGPTCAHDGYLIVQRCHALDHHKHCSTSLCCASALVQSLTSLSLNIRLTPLYLCLCSQPGWPCFGMLRNRDSAHALSPVWPIQSRSIPRQASPRRRMRHL